MAMIEMQYFSSIKDNPKKIQQFFLLDQLFISLMPNEFQNMFYYKEFHPYKVCKTPNSEFGDQTKTYKRLYNVVTI